MSEDPAKELSTEYYKLLDIVNEFDKRLITIKGWGVTLSLGALALGFQYQHYGLFLVASVSAIAFWFIEGVFKKFQMRFYVRMRDIEVINFELSKYKLHDGSIISTPQIDWSWKKAPDYFKGTINEPLRPERYNESSYYFYAFPWFAPHVCLPHIITMVTGGLLFILGFFGRINMPI